MNVKSRNGEKFEIFSNFLAHPVETPRPIFTALYQNVHRSVPYILNNIWQRWENRNGSCHMHKWDHPPFFEFLTPLHPSIRGRWTPEGRQHVGRHCPYTNKIWCGCVHALLRYRSKTTKMQKFPIDSHSNENFISTFSVRRGPLTPKRREDTFWTRIRPHAKLGSNRPAVCREIVDRTNRKTYSKTNTSPFAPTSEWRVKRAYRLAGYC